MLNYKETFAKSLIIIIFRIAHIYKIQSFQLLVIRLALVPLWLVDAPLVSYIDEIQHNMASKYASTN